jgi:hypothetical protein
MTDPIQRFEKNIAEVKRLLDIHTQLAGSSPGRKHNVEVLNKSSIVLLVACWEAFIEDLCVTAFDFMLTNAPDHKIFPDDVLALASKKLKSALDNREVWQLAGDGWRTVLQKHKTEMLKEYVGKLNTPKPKQVDNLFEAMLGITALSQKWSWHNVSHQKTTAKLTSLVELRGEIAHQVAAGKRVTKALVLDQMRLVYRLATVSSNRVRAFVYARTKKRPWPSYKFRNTK